MKIPVEMVFYSHHEKPTSLKQILNYSGFAERKLPNLKRLCGILIISITLLTGMCLVRVGVSGWGCQGGGVRVGVSGWGCQGGGVRVGVSGC